MIIFENVTKQFGDDTIGVEDISFQIKPGELVTVTGPSGSGKTTLMRLLTKEYEPTAGEIVFNQTPLSQIKPNKVHQHRRDIGVIFQDYKLLRDLNVWENIALALDILGLPQSEIEERVTDLLELVDLTDKALLFPVQLSGGEAQRVGIARALAPAPKVIFADEPTGNLDAVTAKHIVSLFSKIHQMGTTVLLSTHDSKVLDQLTDRMIELDKGKLIKDSGASATKATKKTKVEEVAENDTAETDDKLEPQKSGNRISLWLSNLISSKPKDKPDTEQEEEQMEAKTTTKKKSSKKKKVEKDQETVTVSVEKI